MAIPTDSPATLLLSRSDVARLLDPDACILAVEKAFRLHGQGRLPPPAVLGIPVADGGFHIKAGLFGPGSSWLVTKLNANFMDNPRRLGLPGIQGLIVLADAVSGQMLAVLDSIEITALRTAAATAVAAKHLARADARTVAVLGCGTQGRAQLRAVSRVCRVDRAVLHDQDPAAAHRLAADLGPELGMECVVVPDPDAAVREALICLACTPARQPIVRREAVQPGTFIAAVGADAEGKHEVEAALFVGNTIVVDLLEQCATIGDLHHALAAGVVTRDAVHATLGEIVAGRRPARRDDAEIIIFDSTGLAFQDAAAVIEVIQRHAETEGGGLRFDFMR